MQSQPANARRPACTHFPGHRNKPIIDPKTAIESSRHPGGLRGGSSPSMPVRPHPPVPIASIVFNPYCHLATSCSSPIWPAASRQVNLCKAGRRRIFLCVTFAVRLLLALAAQIRQNRKDLSERSPRCARVLPCFPYHCLSTSFFRRSSYCAFGKSNCATCMEAAFLYVFFVIFAVRLLLALAAQIRQNRKDLSERSPRCARVLPCFPYHCLSTSFFRRSSYCAFGKSNCATCMEAAFLYVFFVIFAVRFLLALAAQTRQDRKDLSERSPRCARVLFRVFP